MNPQQQTNYSLENDSLLYLYKYNAVFLGEVHGIYAEPEIKFLLIRYLNAKFGYRHVFMEIGYSAALLYNLYLETGDTSYLRSPVLIYSKYKQEMKFWNDLYLYNLTLRIDNKIKIHGVDFERLEFIKALYLLLPENKETPQAIRETIELIKTQNQFIKTINDYKSLLQLYDKIQKDIRKNEQIFIDFFGKNYWKVKKIMFNESSFNDYKNRNLNIFKNIEEEIKEDKIDKMLAFFGQAHTGLLTNNTTAAYLANQPHWKDSLLSITLFAKNAYRSEDKKLHDYLGWYTYYLEKQESENIFQTYMKGECKFVLVPTQYIQNSKIKLFSKFILLIKDQPSF